jgi:hypothetical protein
MPAPIRPKGLDIGDVAIQRLDPDGAPADQPHGWTLTQATAQIDHLTGTKAELIEAIAYLACQIHGLRKISDRDATLAITNIESIINRYQERKTR